MENIAIEYDSNSFNHGVNDKKSDLYSYISDNNGK